MSRSDQLLDDFEKFHREHPEVWRMFVMFARDMIDRGFDHYSADAICHRIRWEIDIYSHDRFKINDHHAAFFARAWALAFPHRKHFSASATGLPRSRVSGLASTHQMLRRRLIPRWRSD